MGEDAQRLRRRALEPGRPQRGRGAHTHDKITAMTKLLKEAIQKLSQLPEGRQDELARMLIDVAASDLHPYQFSDDERAGIEEALAQADRGEFASEKEVAEIWDRFTL